MPVYITERGEFSTETVGDMEIVRMESGNWVMPGNYAIIGALPDKCVRIMNYGVVYDNEYISKESFCNKIKGNPKLGSNLVLRLLQDDRKSFAPLNSEDDLAITGKVIGVTE